MIATMTTLDPMRRSLAAAALTAALGLGLAAPVQAEQAAPTATIDPAPQCEHDEGPGIAFESSLEPAPDGGPLIPLAEYRPAGGGATTTVPGDSGYLATGVGEFEVRAVFLQPPMVQKGVVNPVVHPGGTYVSDWVPVTVDCVDPEPEPDPDPDPEPEPENEPAGGDEGIEVLADVVVATPTFTG